MSSWHEYVGDTRGSVIASSADHVMRGVSAARELGMCLARGGMGGELGM